jgi:hypothetical protein
VRCQVQTQPCKGEDDVSHFGECVNNHHIGVVILVETRRLLTKPLVTTDKTCLGTCRGDRSPRIRALAAFLRWQTLPVLTHYSIVCVDAPAHQCGCAGAGASRPHPPSHTAIPRVRGSGCSHHRRRGAPGRGPSANRVISSAHHNRDIALAGMTAARWPVGRSVAGGNRPLPSMMTLTSYADASQ